MHSSVERIHLRPLCYHTFISNVIYSIYELLTESDKDSFKSLKLMQSEHGSPNESWYEKEQMLKLLGQLALCTELKRLFLEGPIKEVEVTNAIGVVIKKCASSLEVLHLNWKKDDFTRPRGIDRSIGGIVGNLSASTKLRYLHLGNARPQGIGNVIHSNRDTLRHVHITWGREASSRDVLNLWKAFAECKDLECIRVLGDFSGYIPVRAMGNAVATMLKNNPRMQSLTMQCPHEGESIFASALAKGLTQGPAMRKTYFRGLSVQSVGVVKKLYESVSKDGDHHFSYENHSDEVRTYINEHRGRVDSPPALPLCDEETSLD